MTNIVFKKIRNSILNIEPDALITLFFHSGSYVTANINDISYCDDYLTIDTDEENTAYVPIESIEYITY